MTTPIREIGKTVGTAAIVQSWLCNKRSSRTIQVFIVGDGTGYRHGVAPERTTAISYIGEKRGAVATVLFSTLIAKNGGRAVLTRPIEVR